MKTQSFVAVLLSVVAQCAFAAAGKAPIQATDKDGFSRIAASVRAEMAPEGRYEEVAGTERSRVNARLDEMTALFAKNGDVAQMNQADKVALFNAQEEVNGILLKRDGDRLVCKTEARSGTHFKNTTCKTAREVAKDRNGAQGWFGNTVSHGPPPCVWGGSGTNQGCMGD